MAIRTKWISAVFVMLAAASGFALVAPVIEHPSEEDQDLDLLTDDLELQVDALLSAQRADEPVRLEVVLFEPWRESDLELFRSLGGVLRHTFEAVSYGFSGDVPAGRVRELAALLSADGRLCVIADVLPGGATLDHAVLQIRVRPTVWNAGWIGSTDTTIAILDTGIDDSHTDFSGRVSAGWTDTTSEAFATKRDYHGHGSHVAGIALGSGASYGVGSDPMSVTTTRSGNLPTSDGYGQFDPVEVTRTGTGRLQLTLYWDGTGTSRVNCRNTAWAWMGGQSSSTSPNTLSYDISTAGVYRPYFGNSAGAGGRAYAGNATFGYAPVGDGHQLFRGVAPGARLLGVKVLLSDLTGWADDWSEGLDWCVLNRDAYSIRVINMSLGLYDGNTSATLDAKVANAVANGIVVVTSAGNDYPDHTVSSPGNAARALTVGAVNDLGAMTNYSSNGFSGQGKPDVIAPGGSLVAGTQMISVETNDGDAYNTQTDHTAQNYANMYGTSMASPMVAGLAALLIDLQEDLGDRWGATQAEALAVKALILMTATETNASGEMSWNGGSAPTTPSGNDPSLDRGAADPVEGFGKINGDAAVEALTSEYDFTFGDGFTMGAGALERKARAHWMTLSSASTYDFEVLVPAGGDCDLYIYRGTPDANGRPVIAASSTTAGSADEQITGWQPPSSGLYYAVVKWVSGLPGSFVAFQGLEHTGGLIFADGFESGDLSAW